MELIKYIIEMKRHIMTCLVALIGALCAQAESVSVGDVVMDKGATVSTSISLTNSHNNLVSFQMDVYLPSGVTVNKTGCSLTSRFNNSQELTVGKLSDGVYRLTSTSFSLTPITGTSGAIITLSLTASQTAMETTASVKNICFVTSGSERVTCADATFGLIVKDDQNQSLSLASVPTQSYGGMYSLPSQTDQGLSLTWSVGNSSVATVSGNTLTTTGVGTTTVTATQAGNNTYRPFSKNYELTVSKAPLTVTANSYTITQGDALPTFELQYSGFVKGETTTVLTTVPTASCSATSASAPGSYPITVSGGVATNYSFNYVSGTLIINAKNASNLTIEPISAVTYNGLAQTPEVTVKDGSMTLTSGTDYTVAYSNNTNAGTATVTVTGNGNYSGTTTANFTINKATLTATARNYTITQGDAMPTYEVQYSGFANNETSSVITTAPTASCTATSASAPGTYTITVSGGSAANYNFSYVNGTLTINAKSASGLSIDPIPAVTYNGLAQTPAVTVKDGSTTLTQGTHYTVSYSNNINAGTATVTVTGTGNYSGTKTANFTINKAPLTATAQSYTITQGDALPTYEVLYSGFVNGQTTTVLTTAPVASCTATTASAPGTYDITVSGGVATNYSFTYVKGTLIINAKNASNLTIEPISAVTYNGLAQTPSVTVKDGSTTLTSGTDYSVAYSNNTNAGTATVTVTGKGNYSGTTTANFTINKATLTATATSYTITQGDAMPTFGVEYSGFVNGETASVITTAPTASCTATSASAPGTYTITVSGGSAANYNFSYVNGTLTINAKSASGLSIDPISAVTYNGKAQTPSVIVKDGSTTLASGTDYTVAYSNNINAGTATVTVTGKGNYSGTKTADFTINKAPLTVTANSYTITQGDALPTFEIHYSGFVNGETASVLTTAPTASCPATSASAPGTYDITVSGGVATNYGFTYVKGTLIINSKNASNLTISPIAAVTYNGLAQTPSVTVKDGSTTLTSGTDYSVAYSNNTNAGTATVMVTGKGNYSGTITANFTISKAPLTVKAKSYTMTQGSTLPTFEIEYGGFVNNETTTALTTAPVASCTATSASAPGNYNITVSGGVATNYSFTYVSGKLTITAKSMSDLTIDAIAPVTYNGKAQTPTVTVRDGLKTLAIGTDYTVAYSNNTNAGAATVTVTGVGNYSGTKTSGFTIGRASLTVTAKSYTIKQGDAIPTFEIEYSGFVNNETASVLTTAPTASCTATTASAPGAYEITVGGGVATNYLFTYVKGTLVVNAKNASNLTISPISAVTYNGLAQTPAITVKDGSKTLVNGTDYTIAYSNNINAGTAIVTVTGKGNYTGTSMANFTINKAKLTVTAKSYTITQGDALPAFELQYTGFVNGENETVLTATPSVLCTATSASAPGTYDITVSAGAATNYDFVYVKGTLTINAKDASVMTIEPIAAVTYNGMAQMPAIIVNDGSKKLAVGTDYTVVYSSNTNAGTATVTITGKGNYSGSKTTNFTINKALLTVHAKSYTIKQGDALPTFEIEYSGFVNGETASVLTTAPVVSTTATSASAPGTYDITVSGGVATNYSFTYVKGTLVINAKNASSLTVEPIAAVTYKGLVQMPAVTVKDGSKTLVSGTDYTVAYSNNINAGTATVMVTGKGNYSGTTIANFIINKAPLTVTAKSYTIMKGDAMPEFELQYSGFVNGETTTVLTTAPVANCTATSASAAGTYDITVSGGVATNYDFTYVKGTLTINTKGTSNLTVDPISAVTYNGLAQTPAVTVKDGSITLTSGIDYNVEYSNNINAGTATVTIIGIGSYTGTHTEYFTIEKATLTATAQSYAIKQGEAIPTFEIEYAGFVNNETVSQLIATPVASCTANSGSEPGIYDITVSGGSAANYDFVYVNGTLTITESVGIKSLTVDTTNALIFDVHGNRLDNVRKGVNIIRTRDGKTKKILLK